MAPRARASKAAKTQREVKPPKVRKPRVAKEKKAQKPKKAHTRTKAPKAAKEAKVAAPAAPTASPSPIASGSPAPDAEGEIEDKVRSRVVGMLMRTAAQKLGQASFETCQKIEASLYRQFAQQPKEYRHRARSLNLNLGRPDSRLLQKVLDGSLSATQLAGLSGEDLAPEAVRMAREQERERYFRTEVHLTAGPPKRKRDLYAPAPTGEEDETPRPLTRRRSDAGLSTRPSPKKAGTPVSDALVAMDEGDVGSGEAGLFPDSSSSSSSSSANADDASSSSDSEDSVGSLWEDDFLTLPIAQDAGEQQEGKDEAGCGQAASSSQARAPPAPAPAPAPHPAAPSPGTSPSAALQMLLTMGFEDVPAMKALESTGGDLSRADSQLV